MRVGGVAILASAAVGVVIALVLHSVPTPQPNGDAPQGSVTPAAASSPAMAPDPAPAAEPPAATPSGVAPSAAESATAAEPTPAAAATPASSATVTVAPVASTPATGGASATSAEPFPIAIPLPPVTTAKELQRAEVRCYEVDPEECGRAADAYDAGQLVPRDATRAAHLRKVELTRLNRRCEDRSPHACLVLAGHYESGDGVDENDKHARALVAHARELCRRGAKTECVSGEPK